MEGRSNREVAEAVLRLLKARPNTPYHVDEIEVMVRQWLWPQTRGPVGFRVQLNATLRTLKDQRYIVHIRRDGSLAKRGERTGYWRIWGARSLPPTPREARLRAKREAFDVKVQRVVSLSLQMLGEHYGLPPEKVLSMEIENPEYEGMAFFSPPRDIRISLREFLRRRKGELCRIICEGGRPKVWATATTSVGAQALVPIASNLLVAGWSVDLARLAVVGLSVWGVAKFCQTCP